MTSTAVPRPPSLSGLAASLDEPLGGIGSAPSARSTRTNSNASSVHASPSALDRFVKVFLSSKNQSSPSSSSSGPPPTSASHAHGGPERTVHQQQQVHHRRTTSAPFYATGGSAASSRTSLNSLVTGNDAVAPAALAHSSSTSVLASPSRQPSRYDVSAAATARRGNSQRGGGNYTSTTGGNKTRQDAVYYTRPLGGAGPVVNNTRKNSHSSSYGGGIGESPGASNRSRQNSDSSQSTNLANSVFTHHRHSTSMDTTNTTNTPVFAAATKLPTTSTVDSKNKGGSAASLEGKGEPMFPAAKSTMPSIRGYNNLASLSAGAGHSSYPSTGGNPYASPSARARTPLSETRQPSVLDIWQNRPVASTSSNAVATPHSHLQLRTGDSQANESYVASLAMAPLVTRPLQGGSEPVYIAGTSYVHDDFPSVSSPAVHPSYTNHPPTPDWASPRPRAEVAGGIGAMPHAGVPRRQRSSSVNSYLRRPLESVATPTPPPQLAQTRSGSRNSARTRRTLSRSNSQRSAALRSASQPRVGSRFVRYESRYGGIAPSSANSAAGGIGQSPTMMSRQRSHSFGNLIRRPDRGEWVDEQNSPSVGGTAERTGRTRTRSRSGGIRSLSSIAARNNEARRHRHRRKLISARIPSSYSEGNLSHRDTRLPSQPLGFTWICGARSAARTPSFYDNFEYVSYPGGRRKRSTSRSTVTPSTYRQQSATTMASQGPEVATAPNYESEPEDSATRERRMASFMSTDGLGRYDQVQDLPQGQNYIQRQQVLRRRSRSLSDLNQYSLSSPDVDTNERGPGGLYISAPLPRDRTISEDLIRTPRTAPIPSPEADGTAGRPFNLSHLHRSGDHIQEYDNENDAVDQMDASLRREALFAALPPPTRTRDRTQGPNMYITGNVISSNSLGKSSTAGTVHSASEAIAQAYYQREAAGSGGDREIAPSSSPSMEDIASYEASRVVTGEAQLSPSFSPERYPVVHYGHAFSTPLEGKHSRELAERYEHNSIKIAKSEEGEIGEAFSALGHHRDSLGNQTNPLSRSGSGSQSLAVDEQMYANSPSPGNVSSEAPSTATSAHVLDLNESNFDNLFFKAPPPSGPLPAVPVDSSADEGEPEDAFIEGRQPESPLPDSTKGFVPTNIPRDDTGGSPASPASQDIESHPSPATSAAALRGQEIWPRGQEAAETERLAEERAIQRPPYRNRHATGMTSTTMTSEGETDFYTVAGSVAGSSLALDHLIAQTNRPIPTHSTMERQSSFASARSHLTAGTLQSVVRRPSDGSDANGESTSFNHYPRSLISLQESDIDPISTMRRTDASAVSALRSQADRRDPALYASNASTLLADVQQPDFQRGVLDRDPYDVPRDSRDSFIEFEQAHQAQHPVEQAHRRSSVISSDNKSFIDDTSDDEDEEPGKSPASSGGRSASSNVNRPSVVIEQAEHEEHSQEEREEDYDDTLQPLPQRTSFTAMPLPPQGTSFASGDPDPSHRISASLGNSHRVSALSSTLGVPRSPTIPHDRHSSQSHHRTSSNASVMTDLSNLRDFPVPPPSGGTVMGDRPDPFAAYVVRERTNEHDPMNRTRFRRSGSFPPRASRQTLEIHSPSAYTFSSSHYDEEGVQHEGRADRSSIADSFLDTSASPERHARRVNNNETDNRAHPGFASVPPSPSMPPSLNQDSPVQTSHSSLRMSHLFNHRPSHERTYSDPSVARSSYISAAYPREATGSEGQRSSWGV